MSTRPLYIAITNRVVARKNCENNDNHKWFDRHSDIVESLVKTYLPSGSGFDSGTQLDYDKSNCERLVFNTSFHHMNEGGYYDGWTDHTVTIRSSLMHGFTVSVSGRNRNDIKDYISEVFDMALRTLVEEG